MLPDEINRIMPAGPTADVLVYVLAPAKLIAWSTPHQRGLVIARAGRVPVVGRLSGPTPTIGPEGVVQLRPDVIVDAGMVSPERAAFADQMQQRTGIPYVLVDDSIARMPAMLRSMGAVFGVASRAEDLASYAEHAIAGLRGRLLIRPADQRPRVYFGRGPDGLETAMPGSPAAQVIDEAGAINVAGVLGRGARIAVTREQLLEWNPEIIIAEQRSFYDALLRSPAWRDLPAVRAKRVYLMPSEPFGWIDEPPGVNRLIGLYWLSGLFYEDATQDDMHAVTPEFYDKFYGIKLTPAQSEAMLGPAGVKSAPLATTASVLNSGLLGQNPGATPGTAPSGVPVAPLMNRPPLGAPSTGLPPLSDPTLGAPIPSGRNRRQPTSQPPIQ